VAAVAAFPLAILAGAVMQFGGVHLLSRLFGVRVDWQRWFSGEPRQSTTRNAQSESSSRHSTEDCSLLRLTERTSD
jgi:hypothetical protein